MADNLRWVQANAFPGIDLSTTDHLIQPPWGHSRMAPATMRSMVGTDPFTEIGVANQSNGYSLYSSVDLGTSQAIMWYDKTGAISVYRAALGEFYLKSGDDWNIVASSKLPVHTTNRIRWCVGNNMLFFVDGDGRPKVIGKDYDAGDTTVEWDDEHTVADILYTNLQKSTPTVPGDDFYADGCCYHMDRLVLWKESMIHWSSPAYPTTFYDAADAYQQQQYKLVSDPDGLDITNAISFEGQMLVVGKPFSLHGFVGSDPAINYSHIILDAHRGVFAADSLCCGSGYVWFTAFDGPCKLDANKGVQFIGDELQSFWNTMTTVQKAQVIGWVEDGCYNIVLPIQHDVEQSDIPADAMARFTYDPKTKRWAQSWGVVGPSCIARITTDSQYCLTDLGDSVIRQNYSTTLAGTAFHQEITTPWLEFLNAHTRKWVRSLRFECEDTAQNMTIEYGTDRSPSFVPLSFDPPVSGVLWGDAGIIYAPASNPDAPTWHSPGQYHIEIPTSVHARTFRLRVRGSAVNMRSFVIGYAHEEV